MPASKKDSRRLDRAEWERMWQEHWIGPALRSVKPDAEQQFLSASRTPAVERQRLESRHALSEFCSA
jgi:hypothetical protein